MSSGWALFTTYSGQVCQAGQVVYQEAVALGPCLSYLDRPTGTVLANYRQLYVSLSGGSDFSIYTYQYNSGDTHCSGTNPKVTTDGPYSTSLGCYNQKFTFGPKDPNAQSLATSSSTFTFIPGLSGCYNIPQFNFTGVLTVSFSAPCTDKSTPTSVRVVTDVCLSQGGSSSALYQCNPGFSQFSYSLTTFSGSGTCCVPETSCIQYGSFDRYNRCNVALKADNSRYLYQNQTCTNAPYPTMAPISYPTNPPIVPRTRAPTTSAAALRRDYSSTSSSTSSRTALPAGSIAAIVTSIVVAISLFCRWLRRQAGAGAAGTATATARGTLRRTADPPQAIFEATVTTTATVEPFEVEAVVSPLPPRSGRGKLGADESSVASRAGNRDLSAGLPVVEARPVEIVDSIPEPSAPPASK